MDKANMQARVRILLSTLSLNDPTIQRRFPLRQAKPEHVRVGRGEDIWGRYQKEIAVRPTAFRAHLVLAEYI
jgi:hypothetical protein